MVAMFDFRYAIQQWQAMGIFDVMLPFFLIFTIVYAILQKTGALGKRQGIDAIISMVIAFFAITNTFVVEMLKIILQNTSIAIIVIVALLLVMGLVWGENRPKWWTFIGLFIGLAIFVWILGRVADYYQMYFPGTAIFSQIWWSENMVWIIPILVIVIFGIIVVASGSKKKMDFQEIWKSLTEKEPW